MASVSRVTAFEQLSRLPHFHPAAMKLMAISTESDSTVDEFERVFQSDPVLTADLLLVANSAAFGFRRRVETIKHALALLGVERVRDLAINVLLAAYVRKQPTERVRPIWFHSVATAVVAEALGNIYGVPGLYTIALMHDLGRIALLLSRGHHYAEFLAADTSDLSEAIELETKLCGINHCDAGALLAGTWGFPEIMQVCMVEHHGARIRRPDGIVGLVQMACWMADWLGYPEVKVRNPATPPLIPQRVSNSALEPALLLDLIRQRTSILVS